MTPARKVTRVAVGVLLKEDGSVLLADRPAGKPYAGYWEFPGGKIEEGEPVEQALHRELHEELGIFAGPSQPWVTFEFDYPHAYVELQFRLVCDWHGMPLAREGQQLRFVDPSGVLPQPLLPAAVPALRWLRLPPTIAVVTSAGAEAPRVERASPAALQVVEPGCRAATDNADKYEVTTIESLDAARWRGAWADDFEDLHRAASRGCDFALVRSASLVARLAGAAGPLPTYLPDRDSAGAAGVSVEGPGPFAGRRWVDLRPRVGT
jgi:8-oxo-dGTP diphosphatase